MERELTSSIVLASKLFSDKLCLSLKQLEMPKPWTPSDMPTISDFMLKHSVGLELFWLFELVSAGFKPKKKEWI